MKPAPLDYVAATSSAEAVALLSDPDREAIVLAGGQSLMPMLNMRLARPELLVDLGRLTELDHIDEVDGRLVIGAMTTKRSVEKSALVKTVQPLLHAATLQVGHPQIRSRGTVGGSMAHADPAAEYPAVAVATGAEMRVIGPEGERTIQADDFFHGYLTTALEPGELLVEVVFPLLVDGSGWAFSEFSRRHGDFAIAGVAITRGLDGEGRCCDVRIVLFGVGSKPIRMHDAEQVVSDESPGEDLYSEVAEVVNTTLDEPMSDPGASADYRRHLASVLTRRALAEAVARATVSP